MKFEESENIALIGNPKSSRGPNRAYWKLKKDTGNGYR